MTPPSVRNPHDPAERHLPGDRCSAPEALVGPSTPPGVAEAPHRSLGGPFSRCCAYVTLLTRDHYTMGVQGLFRSLRAVGAQHPLVVMHTPTTLGAQSVAALQEEGCVMRSVRRYLPPGLQDYSRYKNAYFAECWTKLRMWGMTDFDRCAPFLFLFLCLFLFDFLHRVCKL
jgi:hypothetical protein